MRDRYPAAWHASHRASLTHEDLEILHGVLGSLPRRYVLRPSKQRTYSDLAMDSNRMDTLTRLTGVCPAVRLTLLELGDLA